MLHFAVFNILEPNSRTLNGRGVANFFYRLGSMLESLDGDAVLNILSRFVAKTGMFDRRE